MTLQKCALMLAGIMVLALPAAGHADAGALFGDNAFVQNRRALMPPAASEPRGGSRLVASLFVDQSAGSLFAPLPERRRTADGLVLLGPNGSAAERIRHLISYAESGPDGYNAINHGARLRPPSPPTEMTLEQIYSWIAETPGQPHAIGRYQFIPVTLKRLAKKTGTSPQEVFSPRLQDRLADVLLIEAGFHTFREGGMQRTRFMENLAGIWAGLPMSNGKSRYHGFAGNRATMSWDRFDREMAQIFPG